MVVLILPSVYEAAGGVLDVPKAFDGKLTVLSPGMGKLKTLAALYEHELKYGKPEFILLSGYAGSLDAENLPIGKQIEGECFIEADYDDDDLAEDSHVRCNKNLLLGPDDGVTFYCQDRFLKTNPYRTFLKKATDMESYALASYCYDKEISFAVLKVISDIVGRNDARAFVKKANELVPEMRALIALGLDEIARRM